MAENHDSSQARKKRSRIWWLLAGGGGGVALLALVLYALGLLEGWLLEGESRRRLESMGYSATVDHFANLFDRGAIQAAPYLRPLADQKAALDLTNAPRATPASAREWLARFQAVPDLGLRLEKASQADCLVFARPGYSGAEDPMAVVTVKEAVQILANKGISHSLLGQKEEAIRALEGAVSLSVRAGDPPTILAYLVSTGCSSITVRAATSAGIAQRDDPAFLGRLIQVIHLSGPDPDASSRLQGELIYALAGIGSDRQAVALLNGDEEVPENLSIPKMGSVYPSGPIGRAMAGHTMSLALKVHEILVDDSLTLVEQEARLKALDRELRTKTKWAERHISHSAPGRHLVSSGLKNESTQLLGEAYLRVLAFRAKNGRWPESLREARFNQPDPRLGKPMGYRKEGEGFRVWAAAMTGVSANGAAKWESKGAPYDEVLTYPWLARDPLNGRVTSP